MSLDKSLASVILELHNDCTRLYAEYVRLQNASKAKQRLLEEYREKVRSMETDLAKLPAQIEEARRAWDNTRPAKDHVTEAAGMVVDVNMDLVDQVLGPDPDSHAADFDIPALGGPDSIVPDLELTAPDVPNVTDVPPPVAPVPKRNPSVPEKTAKIPPPPPIWSSDDESESDARNASARKRSASDVSDARSASNAAKLPARKRGKVDISFLDIASAVFAKHLAESLPPFPEFKSELHYLHFTCKLDLMDLCDEMDSKDFELLLNFFAVHQKEVEFKHLPVVRKPSRGQAPVCVHCKNKIKGEGGVALMHDRKTYHLICWALR